MSWSVSVTGLGQTGTGAVIAARLVLTCWHVVQNAEHVDVAIAGTEPNLFGVVDADQERDIALLEPVDPDARLDDDLVVVPRALWRGARPPGDRALVELCITETDLPSSIEIELRPAPASAQHVEFVVPADRESVEHGYSGAPVLELRAGSSTARLLGIVRARDPWRVDVLDRAGTGWLVPMERIAERFAQVAAHLETPVERSHGWLAHWQPRARGVVKSAEPGHFFTGRKAACAAVRKHLRQASGLGVVTGSRGCGKSAVLAHVLACSCPRYRTLVEAADPDAAVRLNAEGMTAAVDAAVLARDQVGKLSGELARQLGFEPCGPDELVDIVARERPGCRIVIDAVDESPDPDSVMRELIVPLSDHAAVAIAALKHYVELHTPSTTTWIDLDGDPYRDDDAIPPYVMRRLVNHGVYAHETAGPVAAAVAKRATGNFLVAELVAHTLTNRPPIDISQPGWHQQLPVNEADAFRGYLTRFGSGSDQRRVLALLTPLAHAHGDGLTLPEADKPNVWLATANALKPDTIGPITDRDLREICELANDYLVVGDGRGRRLYHEGLAGAVRSLTSRGAGAAEFLEALMKLLPADREASADAYDALDPYLLRHLPTHLYERGRAAELLERPGLLLAGDTEALRSALVRGALTAPDSREGVRIAVVHALARAGSNRRERAAALGGALLRQGEREHADAIQHALLPARLAYELVSGPDLAPVISTIPDAHHGSIPALALLEHEGEPLVLSGGDDGALRSWRLDGSPGPLTRQDAHHGSIRALALLETHEGRPLVLTGGDDGAWRSWRLDGSAIPVALHNADRGPIEALVVLETHEGHPLVVSGGADGALRSWRLDGSPGPLTFQDAHHGSVRALELLEAHAGQAPLLLSGGDDGALRTWRLDGSIAPLTLEQEADHRSVRAVAFAEHDGQPIVISGGEDGALRSWRLDGRRGPLNCEDAHDCDGITALKVVKHDGRPLLISASERGDLTSWWLNGSRGPLAWGRAHKWDPAHDEDAIQALAVAKGGRSVVSSAGADGAVRSWRPHGGVRAPTAGHAHGAPIRSLCVLEHDNRPLVISADDEGEVRSWRLDGSRGPLYVRTRGSIWALAVAEAEQPPLVITASDERDLRSWRLDGRPGPLNCEEVPGDPIEALAVVEHEGQTLLISGSYDGALRSWWLDGRRGPLDREQAHIWRGIPALDVVQHEGQLLVISAGADGALRSWWLDGSPGPLNRERAHRDPIRAVKVTQHDEQPLVISAGTDGAVHTCRLDGSLGPLNHEAGDNFGCMALAILEHAGEPLIITAGDDRALRSWRLDGRAGPLSREEVHSAPIRALAVARPHDRPLLISASEDRTILAHAASNFSYAGSGADAGGHVPPDAR